MDIKVLDTQEGSESIEAQAREWLLYLYSDEACEAGRHRFKDWLNASSEHVAVYHALEQVWRDLPLSDDLYNEVEQQIKQHAIPSLNSYKQKILYGFGVLATLLMAWVTFLLMPEPITNRMYFATEIGEIRTVNFPDGSSAVLDSNSSLTVEFSKKRRSVQLQYGRVYFDVKRERERVFSIDAGYGQVRVLGTAFDVWRDEDELSVSVVKGHVELESTSADQTVIEIRAGESVSALLNGSFTKKKRFNPALDKQWQIGRLAYIDKPLSEVIKEVNRYQSKPIVLEPSLADIRITMSFRKDQLGQFLSGIERTLPVYIERQSNSIKILPKL